MTRYTVLTLWSLATSASAFLPASLPQHHGIVTTGSCVPSTTRIYTPLQVVADVNWMEEEKKKKRDDDSSDWIETKDGGFIPRIKARMRASQTKTPKTLTQVTDIHQYKQEVADVQDRMVCVRFYAPWCRACKAVEGSFRRLAKEFPEVKFVEVPVTKDNSYLHQGLGVPSLPFAHVYDPKVGLVEERRINKNLFAEFKKDLKTYVDGECLVNFDEDGSTNFMM